MSPCVVTKILDNTDKCAYLINEVLVLKEFSLAGKTNSGGSIKPDVQILTDLFKKPLPLTNNNNETTNEFLSFNGKIEWSINNENELIMSFPEGLVVGVAAVYFRILNDKITFEVDQNTQRILIAEMKERLIDPQEPIVWTV